jgi:ribosomal protein RSM22 (predicted rRNA methylase)
VTRSIVALPPAIAAALPRGGGSVHALSARYRGGALSAGGHVIRDDAELRAYATARFPATYAAAVAALEECTAFTPLTALDVGSGLGATAAAAAGVWPELAQTCLERDPRALAAGRAVLPTARWHQGDLTAGLPDGRFDLVTAGYVLTELTDPLAAARSLWERTAGLLVLIEPGRRAAYESLMEIRTALIAAGAHVLAPCPHAGPCPLLGRDWCHFAQRLPRTAAHRAAKGAERSHEDEPFSFLALTRTPAGAGLARVVRRPEQRKGLVLLDLCRPDGTVTAQPVPKSAGADYRRAKDVLWGQTFS